MSQPVGGESAAARWGSRRALDRLSACALSSIAIVAILTRLWRLGQLSFWYDEVVTMRLARAGTLRGLFELLFQIDATRAPLHPLLLQSWTRAFGPSEAAARSLSVVCGLATILLIFDIGRVAFDRATGLWAAWLAALSPILIVYSREARMYAWLVLVTCVSWRLLFALARACTTAQAVAYAISLTALVYSHPLGLLMLGALTLAGLFEVSACFGTWKRWLSLHLVVVILVLPWIGNYFDHPPEFLSGRLPFRFLLGTPISFIGGNFLMLAGLTVLIMLGLARHRSSRDPDGAGRPAWTAPVFLLLWLVVPPTALYVYSRLSYPVFGPARYTVFVAPAYLVLVAAGLSRLPAWGRYPLALGIVIVSSLALGRLAYDPALKADWRDFSASIAQEMSDRPERKIAVIVASAESDRDVNLETARYYLPAGCAAIAYGDATAERLDDLHAALVCLTVGTRLPGLPVPESLGPYHFREVRRFPGLVAYRGTR
jgi:uncharacterized membrane protein